MAEIQSQSGNNRRKGAVRRSKKLSTKVDLTPMVDLGFLLITFFIITTTWSSPRAMRFLMPAGEEARMPVAESTALTLIPLAGNQVFYYHGEPADLMDKRNYGVTGYDISKGIGDIIRQKQMRLNESSRFNSKDLMLMIKPSTASSYKNIVDVLDEVLINDIRHYMVSDLTEAEKQILKKYSSYRAD